MLITFPDAHPKLYTALLILCAVLITIVHLSALISFSSTLRSTGTNTSLLDHPSLFRSLIITQKRYKKRVITPHNMIETLNDLQDKVLDVADKNEQLDQKVEEIARIAQAQKEQTESIIHRQEEMNNLVSAQFTEAIKTSVDNEVKQVSSPFF